MIMRPFKFTDTLTAAWYLRTVFVGNLESVASYKHWFYNDRKVRGQNLKIITDIKICFEI